MVDPLSEKYYSITPYDYVANNPIRLIDPDGMRIDDYKLNQDGTIEFVDNTNSSTDELYATKEDGTIDRSKSVSVKKGTFKNKLTAKGGKVSGFKTDDIPSAKKVFKFASDNNQKTNTSDGIEFGIIEYTENGTDYGVVITDGEPSSSSVSKVAEALGNGGATIGTIGHNHPKGNPPTGYDNRGRPLPGAPLGDIYNAVNNLPNNANNNPIKRFVYAPGKNLIMHYNATGYTSQPSIIYFGF